MKLALPLILMCLGMAAHAATTLYVAPTGDNKNPGTKAKPFATLTRARDAIRDLKARGSFPAGGVTVYLRGGVYRLDASFALAEQDSGTKAAPIVYSAFGQESVRILGGRNIPPALFRPVTDPAIRERLDEKARDHIVCADLKTLGMTDFGSPWPNTFRGYNGWPELFCDGQPMQLARWPNEGFAMMGKVLDSGSKPRESEKPDRPGKFVYQGDRPERWLKADEVYLNGYWCFKWFNECLKVGKIDPQEKSITFVAPHVYGVGGPSGGYFYALNLLEELDSPGEYYLDRKTGMLYFWPPEGKAAGETPAPPAPPTTPALHGRTIALSTLQTPMVALTNASHVTLRGLTFEVSRGMAVTISGGRENLVTNCTIRNIATDAISISGGEHNGVAYCEMYNMGAGGISLSGGDRATLIPCGNYAENNHIHDYGRLFRTHRDAINFGGVGCRAAHNCIHDAPHHAMDFGGNDHVVEFNEVYRVCMETDDAGAIYTGRNWSVQGNIIRNNYFHDIGGGPNVGNQAIYLDDCAAGTQCLGNVIVRVGRAFLIGGGRDNVMNNNVIVDCPIPMHIDNRGIGIAKTHDENWGTLTNDFKTLPWKQPPWSTRYPFLLDYLDNQPGYPLRNQVCRNVIVRCGAMNLAKEAREAATIQDNLETKDAPGFVDAAKGDYALKPDAIVWAKVPGFEKIPFAEIGLRKGVTVGAK